LLSFLSLASVSRNDPNNLIIPEQALRPLMVAPLKIPSVPGFDPWLVGIPQPFRSVISKTFDVSLDSSFLCCSKIPWVIVFPFRHFVNLKISSLLFELERPFRDGAFLILFSLKCSLLPPWRSL